MNTSFNLPLANNSSNFDYRTVDGLFQLPDAQLDKSLQPALLKNLTRLNQKLVQSMNSEVFVFGLRDYRYTSKPQAAIEFRNVSSYKPYIRAYVATPTTAGELYNLNLANIFNPNWKAELASAINLNGGLGSGEEGFLAWSKEGFARLYNSGLTHEQNKNLAAMSLQMGIAIEDLPSRTTDSIYKSFSVNRWVEKFLESYKGEFQNFLRTPEGGINIKDGKRRYQLSLVDGVPHSRYYKKKSGLVGFVSGLLGSAKKTFSKTIDFAKEVSSQIVDRLISKGTSFVKDLIPSLSDVLRTIADGLDKPKVFAKETADNLISSLIGGGNANQ